MLAVLLPISASARAQQATAPSGLSDDFAGVWDGAIYPHVYNNVPVTRITLSFSGDGVYVWRDGQRFRCGSPLTRAARLC